MSDDVRITPYRDGPLLVRGPFRLVDQDGRDIEVDRRTVALCRCGRSGRKPFCDGTHKVAGWRAESGPRVRGEAAPDDRVESAPPLDAASRRFV